MKQEIIETYHSDGNIIQLWREEVEAADSWGTPGDRWWILGCIGHDEKSGEFEFLKSARAAMKSSEMWCLGCRRRDPIDEENFESIGA